MASAESAQESPVVEDIEKFEDKKMVTELFVEGARKGFHLGTHNIIPNVLMAFVIIQILRVSGLLDLIGWAFGPLMGLFGMPGVAATVFAAAWMGMAGAVGVTVSLFADGLLNGYDLTILAPTIFVMGSQVQYIGRLLATSDVEKKHYPALLVITLICGVLCMFVMSLIAR